MMTRAMLASGLALALSTVPSAGEGSQLQDGVAGFPARGALGYLRPLQIGIGQALNSHLYSGADIRPNGYRIHVRVGYLRVGFAADDASFSLAPGEGFRPAAGEDVRLPTVVGSGGSVTIPGMDGRTYAFPGGWDLSGYTLVVPEVVIEGADGNEVMLRWLANFEEDGTRNLGRFWLFGAGFRHSLSRHLRRSPVDLSAGFFVHTLAMEKAFLKINTYSFGVQAGRDWGHGSVFCGVSYDVSNMSVSYATGTDAEPVLRKVSNTETAPHLTLGSRLTVHRAELVLDFHVARRTGFSVSLGGAWP